MIEGENKNQPAPQKQSPTIKAKESAELLFTGQVDEGCQFIRFDGSTYKYREGVWELLCADEESMYASEAWEQNVGFPISISAKGEVLNHLTNITYKVYKDTLKQRKADPAPFLSLQDYVVDKNEMQIPHSQSNLLFHKIPFNPIKGETPIWDAFLITSLGLDQFDKNVPDFDLVVQFVYEWLGYCLWPGNPFEKALILIGNGGNGKRIFMDTLEAITGKANCSHAGIRGINTGELVWMVKNKLINFSSDVEGSEQLDTEELKRAISGETLTVRQKYKDQTEMKFTAKVVIACNNLPFSKSPGNDMRRRFIIFPFLREIPEEEKDPYLIEKLVPELPMILYKAIEARKRLMERDGFIIPPRFIEEMEEYIISHDSTAMWAEEHNITPIKYENLVPRAKAYDHYRNYCDRSGLKPLSAGKFYRQLKKMKYKFVKRSDGRYIANMPTLKSFDIL